MEYITRQSQGDFCILDQRDGNLWMDAGMVTTQADWSLDFDIGMNFFEWHAPVPLAHEMGVFDRALKFLLNLQQGKPARRLNWTMTINPRLDTSPENYHKWGPDRTTVTPENVGEKVHLRVELQSFWRLPRSNAHRLPDPLLSDQDGRTGDRRRNGRAACTACSATCRDELADYKGLTRYRPTGRSTGSPRTTTARRPRPASGRIEGRDQASPSM